jgi:methionine-gamma-lyase
MVKAKRDTSTVVIHSDKKVEGDSAVVPPIYTTATFAAGSAEEFHEMATVSGHKRFYTRYGNPTHERAEAIIAELEGAEAALMTASGMGAITTAVMTFVSQGDHIVGQEHCYGGTTTLLRDVLPRFGVEVTLVDQADTAAFERAIKKNTKLIVLESPSNPLLRLTDLRVVAALARANSILTLIDNTFATPINQRPIELGIDLVAHSATKYLAGHSDIIAGVVAGSRKLVQDVWNTSLVFGATLGPFDSWLALRGLRTLPMRVERHNQTALAVAKFLEGHARVERVNYPGLESHPQHELARSQMSGFTGMMSFELTGGVDVADRFISRVQLASNAPGLGGVESLIVRPAAMLAHQINEEQFEKIGVTPKLIRLSVGLENERDLIADIEQALS